MFAPNMPGRGNAGPAGPSGPSYPPQPYPTAGPSAGANGMAAHKQQAQSAPGMGGAANMRKRPPSQSPDVRAADKDKRLKAEGGVAPMHESSEAYARTIANLQGPAPDARMWGEEATK